MMDYSLEMNTTAYADFKLIDPTTVSVLKDGILKHLGNNGDGNRFNVSFNARCFIF